MRAKRREKILQSKSYVILGFVLEFQEQDGYGLSTPVSAVHGMGKTLLRAFGEVPQRVSARIASKIGATKLSLTGVELLELQSQLLDKISKHYSLMPVNWSSDVEYRIVIRLLYHDNLIERICYLDICQILFVQSQANQAFQIWYDLTKETNGILGLCRFFNRG